MYILHIEHIFVWTSKELRAQEPQVAQFCSVQSLSLVQLFATPWIAAHQASLSITNSRSSLRLLSIESVMPSSHLILCPPAPNPSQHQSLVQWVNSLHEVASGSYFGKTSPTSSWSLKFLSTIFILPWLFPFLGNSFSCLLNLAYLPVSSPMPVKAFHLG